MDLLTTQLQATRGMTNFASDTYGLTGKQRVKGAIFGHLEGNTCLFLFAGQSVCLLAQTESIDVTLVQISSLCFVRGSYLETNRARKVNLKSVLMDK